MLLNCGCVRGATDEAEQSPFFGIEKGAVLQESRVFHDQQLDARQCAQVITKLLYLINQGEHFTKTEATEVSPIMWLREPKSSQQQNRSCLHG